MPELYVMTEDEVITRLKALSLPNDSRVYGVPRGGACLTQYLSELTGNYVVTAFPETADLILDDIIDSGATKARFAADDGVVMGIPFYAIVDKISRKADRELGWIQFPWETETSPEDAVTRLLEYIGEDTSRAGLKGTPERVCRAMQEMTSGYEQDPDDILSKVFPSDHDELIISTGIRFTSMCEHHMLPFSGVASVGYIPKKGKVVGISKLARVVECFAKRLQLQERMTAQVAEAVETALAPVGVGVIVKAHHSCMGCRGVKQPDAEMVTSCMFGALRTKPEARSEFLRLSGI